ncbi:LysE family transporter [Streptomyces lydicus]|nr:LysE family transporter [Streptomyces lydicus]
MTSRHDECGSGLCAVHPGDDDDSRPRHPAGAAQLCAGRAAYRAATAVGAALGPLAWAVAAAIGLAAALQRWDAAFTVVRLAGAAYLVLLGGQALWAQRRPGAPPSPGTRPLRRRHRTVPPPARGRSAPSGRGC